MRQQQELMDLPLLSSGCGTKYWPALIGRSTARGRRWSWRTCCSRSSRRAHALRSYTGVPTVDTLVAQHLMKTVAATRLLSALHYQRHPSSDCPDHRASGCEFKRYRHQSHAGRCIPGCARLRGHCDTKHRLHIGIVPVWSLLIQRPPKRIKK